MHRPTRRGIPRAAASGHRPAHPGMPAPGHRENAPGHRDTRRGIGTTRRGIGTTCRGIGISAGHGMTFRGIGMTFRCGDIRVQSRVSRDGSRRGIAGAADFLGRHFIAFDARISSGPSGFPVDSQHGGSGRQKRKPRTEIPGQLSASACGNKVTVPGILRRVNFSREIRNSPREGANHVVPRRGKRKGFGKEAFATVSYSQPTGGARTGAVEL